MKQSADSSALRGNPGSASSPDAAARDRIQPAHPDAFQTLTPDEPVTGHAARDRPARPRIASRLALSHVAIESTRSSARCAAFPDRARKRWPLLPGRRRRDESPGWTSVDAATDRSPCCALQRTGPAGSTHPRLSPIPRQSVACACSVDRPGAGKVSRTVVLVGHAVRMPPELEKLAARFASPCLTRSNQGHHVREVRLLATAKRPGGQGRTQAFDLLLRHVSALPNRLRRLVRQALEDGVLEMPDIDRLVSRKHELIGRDSVLSFEMDTARSPRAGLAGLKTWLDRRRESFLGDAKP